MKVLRCREDQRFVVWHALDLVCPFSCNLDGSFDRLGPRVHWKHHVISKGLLNLLSPLWEDIVVECARRESQALCLLAQGFDQFGMAVTLVDCAVGREAVDVVVSFRIPDTRAARACKDDWQGVVVVRSIFGFGGNCRGTGRCVVFRIGQSTYGLEGWCSCLETASALGRAIRMRSHAWLLY